MKRYPLREAEYLSYVDLADVALQNVNRETLARSRKEVDHNREAWSRVHKDRDLHPLCYEHHMRMQSSQIDATSDELKRVLGYFCPEPGCSVGYTCRDGYFVVIPGREYTEEEIIPCVSCPCDGGLMYLAQISLDTRSFRLWKCPLCKMSRTNREVLTP